MVYPMGAPVRLRRRSGSWAGDAALGKVGARPRSPTSNSVVFQNPTDPRARLASTVVRSEFVLTFRNAERGGVPPSPPEEQPRNHKVALRASLWFK